ncbi:unnamed protein product [Symbiodinium sp. CCMP2592]|nr:unnamed protein product [Symbiodinium sp. CCMP2592]
MFAVDTTEELPATEATKFRTMLGKVLYMSNERPDAQALSDSNFANDRETRKSLSSGQIYIDQALMYSFVRGQKVVTLSSGEAELVALTQATSEAILVHKAWKWVTKEAAELGNRQPVGSWTCAPPPDELLVDPPVGGEQAPQSRGGADPVQPQRHGNEEPPAQEVADALLLGWCGGRPWREIGQTEHTDATGQEVLGRRGGGGVARVRGRRQRPDTRYVVEIFYANPLVMVLLVVIYMLVTSRWSFTAWRWRQRPEQAHGKDKGTETEERDSGAPAEQLDPGYGVLPGHRDGRGGQILESSTSTTGPTATRAQQRVTLAEQRRGLLESALELLTEQELGEMVWTTSSAYAYHRRTCGNIRHSARVSSRTARDAIRLGKAACNQCYADHFCPVVHQRFPGQGL